MLIKILLTIFYIVPTVMLLAVYVFHLFVDDLEKWWKEIVFALLICIPFVSLYTWIMIIFDKKIKGIKRERERKRKIKYELEERERKIKLGIIKLTEADPFGEEVW